MILQDLLNKPLWQMTGEEFLFLSNSTVLKEEKNKFKIIDATSSKYDYSLKGIVDLFSCSIPTANRIKKSGKIDNAIKQIGLKIIVKAELAFELAGQKMGDRRRT